MDYFGGLQMGGGVGGLAPAAQLAQQSSYDPWQIMAMVDQSPTMQQSFGAPMPANMGPQQPAGAQPGLGQLLGMMGGAQPGLFNPQAGQRLPPVGGAGAFGSARQVAAPNYAVGAPTRAVPSLGQLLGRG